MAHIQAENLQNLKNVFLAKAPGVNWLTLIDHSRNGAFQGQWEQPHLRPGFRVPRSNSHAICSTLIGCIDLASSNQGGANSVTVSPGHAKSQPQMLIASKAAFLENYLAVSAWILNGTSIEYHEKKRQPFCLSGVRFRSQAILISG